jgi:serine protease Do
MLVVILAMLTAQATPQEAPPPIVAEARPAPAEPPLTWVHVGAGRKLAGRIVKETAEHLFLDVGFDILRIPLTTVLRRELDQAVAASSEVFDEEVFYRGNLAERSLSEGAAAVGAAVVKVESPAGQGSGFITSPDGYLVTNFHVVDGELEVDVTLYLRNKAGFDLRTVRKCKVLATNPQIDLALVKMEPPADVVLSHVFLADSEKVRVGDTVYAIGTPIGLERTVSSGIVSVTNRVFGGHTMFQITTPLNPGNSGGPLFNLRTEVVGVNSAGYMGLQGLNFAIPSKYVIDFLRNRDAFAVDRTRSENGIHYFPAPRKPKPGEKQG